MRYHFDKKPGQHVGIAKEDDTVVIVADVPDTVRLPPELGGHEVRVLRAFDAPCPRVGCPHTVRHLALDHDGAYVAECGAHGFLWYRRAGG